MDIATVAGAHLTSTCPFIISQKESNWALTIVAAYCVDTEVLTPALVA